MTQSFISALTLDDLMNSVFRTIDTDGIAVEPTKGPNREIRGVLLELTNPRARLSRTETRGKPFSCLGELCWYLAGSDDLQFITYYIPVYEKEADQGVLCGAYGPRLIGRERQFDRVVALLQRNPSSRKGVIQLFKGSDVESGQKDVPCTCTLQFFLREGKLDLVVSMRSNDAYKGLPHDVFCFTMIQELMARQLSADVGTYKHMVGSLHLYDTDAASAQQFLKEGFQSTRIAMPSMPLGNPWPAVHLLLRFETAVRQTGDPNTVDLSSLDPYWQDLGRLLRVFRSQKYGRAEDLLSIRDAMASGLYKTFIDKKYEEMSRAQR